MHRSFCAGQRTRTDRDSYPSEPGGDPFWLGGEAFIAPACLSDLRDVHDANRVADAAGTDSDWQVI
ncbi:MAG: hypothetical protein ABJB02_07850 [Dokdonella sp.]